MGGVMGAVIAAIVLVAMRYVSVASGLGFWFELIGGAALGAAVGGVFLALASSPLSWDKARWYQKDLEKGRFIVTVNNPQRRHEAEALLKN
jgi:hypothetical protein